MLFFLTATLTALPAQAGQDSPSLTAEQQSVVQFWKDMGPTLTNHGVEAYAIRYHDEFRHWDIARSGAIVDKKAAVDAYTRFHESGHRITCTHVEPVTVDVIGDHAIARLRYEESSTDAEGAKSTHKYRMVAVFKRMGDTWQVLETNMVEVDLDADEAEDAPLAAHCHG